MPMCPAVQRLSVLSALLESRRLDYAILPKKRSLCDEKSKVRLIVSTVIVMWFVMWLSGSYCPQTSGTLPPLVKMCFSRSTRRPFSSFLSFHSSYEMLVFPHSRGCSLLSLSFSSPEPGLAAAVFSLQSEVFMLTSIHKVALTIPSTSSPVCTKVGNRCLNVGEETRYNYCFRWRKCVCFVWPQHYILWVAK